VAKRPDLLILDEPVSALDPLARREFLQGLMESRRRSPGSVSSCPRTSSAISNESATTS
jgi:ABC-type multidrug transport system ATPase subunit